MAAFFGAFTVPRIFSSYSIQVDRYGKFLLERSRDAWDSCTHKKAAAVAAFTVMWNLSSAAARTWAVFMLVVVVRYYQQQQLTAMKWGDVDDDNINAHPGQKQGGATAAELSMEPSEEKGQQQQHMVAPIHRHNAEASETRSEVMAGKKA